MNRKHASLLAAMSLTAVSALADIFFRISRGELVNLEYVIEIVPWFSGTYKIRLTTGTELDVSRDRGRRLKEVMNI